MSQPADVVRLESPGGVRAELLCIGASLRSLVIPTTAGPVELVLKHDQVEDYLTDPYYLGSTLGRYANRIEGARFTIDECEYTLAATPGQDGHCLHGGVTGFSHRRWRTESTQDPMEAIFYLRSPNGDQGFPGKLDARVSYRLLNDRSLLVTHEASTDQPTVVSLANHTYFNLNGDASPATDHLLRIEADHFTPVDKSLIPTGEIRSVDGTPFDFRDWAGVGERLECQDEQLVAGHGFDHNFVLRGAAGEMREAARLRSDLTGIELRISTTQPGLQLYTGQYLGQPFEPFQGVCLETQAFPNAPNTPVFPDTLLRPGTTYRQQTLYELSLLN